MSVINSYNKDSSQPKSLLLLDKSAVFIELDTKPVCEVWAVFQYKNQHHLYVCFFFMKQRHRLWKYRSRRRQDEINIDESLTNILRGRMQDPSWEKIFAKILLMLFRLFQVAASREKKTPLPSLKVSW